MKFKRIKKQLKEMKEPILEQIAVEQELQAKLRTTIITSEDEEEVKKSKLLLMASQEHWEMLMKAVKEYEALSAKKWKFSPDTLLTVGANLFGLLLVLNFEKSDIIRSKAFGLIAKLKL